MRSRLGLLIGMIFAAAGMRLLPHPPNFESIGALALFAGAHFDDKRWAFVLPLAAMLLSDAVIGFHGQMPVVYGTFALVVWLGVHLRERRTALNVAGAGLAASILFFVVTNFGVWAFDGLYPRTLEGLVVCYIAAIPFFGYTLAGNLFYAALLFGGFALAERKIPVFSPAARS
ncbi:MAG: hypothetical protein HYY45_13865 [Deltaproteobacteria bacterium]|nr:hypothetical protein [Deltaproteobacteria bacterium]